MASAPETVPGSVAAKECGLALAQIYNYIRTGKVTNHKKDGWPTGKGIEVVLAEVQAAASAPKKARAPKGSGSSKASASGGGRISRKARHADEVVMHEAISADEAERRQRKRSSGDEGNTVRLRRLDRTTKYPPCPVNPAHGELALVREEEKSKKNRPVMLHCWHQEHDGRPRSHPGGFAPATQSFFTEEEAQMPQPVGRLGVIMLEWITAGRPDLSDALESWMNKQKLPVWIPVPVRPR